MFKKTFAKLNEINSKIDYRIACWQGHCPTVKEIEDSGVKSLASRLNGQSKEDTLTNILEWQDRNMSFWTERHPISTILYAFLGALIFFGIVAIRVIVILASSTTLNSVFIGTFWFVGLPLTVLITGTILTLAIIVLIIRANRKIPLKEGFAALKRGVPINLLLKNKLGVCRDYAKLTACLLLNIYPNTEIYFATAPSHVATGIMIENKLYMLDQRLPILTIDKWKTYRSSKAKKIAKLVKERIVWVDFKTFLSKNDIPELDTKKLAQTMTKLLKIQPQAGNNETAILRISLRKGIKLYEDDEMVNYSLSRWLQSKLSMELIEISEITKIEVISEKEDLIFLIHLGFRVFD
jgi:predicted transglutaminase-like protease